MNYTHRDGSGMSWRFVGSRPVSALADQVMRQCGLRLPDEKGHADKHDRDAAQPPVGPDQAHHAKDKRNRNKKNKRGR